MPADSENIYLSFILIDNVDISDWWRVEPNFIFFLLKNACIFFPC